MNRPVPRLRRLGAAAAVLACGTAVAAASTLPSVPMPRLLPERAPASQPTSADTLPIYSPREVSTQPEPVSAEEHDARLRAAFGPLADAGGGQAEVEWVVEPDGTVRRVRVIRAEPAELGQALSSVLRGSRFRPGTLNGEPVRVRQSMEWMVGPRAPVASDAGSAAARAAARREADAARSARANARARQAGAVRSDAAAAEASRAAAARAPAGVRWQVTASGRSRTATDTLSPAAIVRRALQTHRPELASGSARPVTVYFVVDSSRQVQRSIVAATGQPALRVESGSNFQTRSAGGSSARLHVRDNAALGDIPPETVQSVEIWTGSILPTNVSIGWVVVGG